jgi:uncharacterized radical SAM superfamily Fe-S cluster-containing enzyme
VALSDYIFHEANRSLCSTCGRPVDAKIVIRSGSAFLLKRCPDHGKKLEVFEEDATWLTDKLAFAKPGNRHRSETEVREGCPFDCGLCPDHEQHTCIGVIEITNACDLGCPVCYANAGADGEPLPLETIARMMEFYKRAEGGRPEICQISGGEPTTHPQLAEVLALAKKTGFTYVMLNTNGLRIASDPGFARSLAELTPGFEVYLQFDGVTDKPYQKLRGGKLLEVKRQAIANLQAARVPVTLVATIARGVNDRQIGDIVRFGLDNEFVRGVNFQPQAFFGRGTPRELGDRVTLSGIRREIATQTGGLFAKSDIVALPCDIDRVAVTYAIREGDTWTPITSRIQVDNYVELIDNTMDFRAEDLVKNAVASSISKGIGCDCFRLMDELKAMLPADYLRWSKRERAAWIDRNTFRITISSFIDRYDFDATSIRRECAHIITPDLRRIPFSAYNMVHRDRADAGEPASTGATSSGAGA